MANDHISEGGAHTPRGWSPAPEGRFGEGQAPASSRQQQMRSHPRGRLLFEEADDVPLGWDASHGSDAGLEVTPDLLVLPTLTDGVAADASSEWGSGGALARALLSSALTDVAPPAVRERVLSAVDAALYDARRAVLEADTEAGAAFPAEAAPVTTLSGVFEKRRSASEAVSCVESSLHVAAVDASIEQPLIGQNAAVASFAPACVEVPSSCAAACCAAAPPELVRVDAGARGPVGAASVHRSASSKPISAVPLAGSFIKGGGFIKGGSITQRLFGTRTRGVLPGDAFPGGVLFDAPAAASSLHAPLAAPERSRLRRLGDGVVASAFNLVQLAAAIVVGVAIGKAGHLLMGEEHARASSSSARASGVVRGEPSAALDAAALDAAALDAVRVADPRGESGPRAVRSWSSDPTHVATAAGSWASMPTSTASVPGSRATASKNASGRVSARSPLSNQTAQSSAAARQLADDQLAPNQLAANARPAVAPVSEDWLGEQLVILGRAERRLLEGDPEGAIRSLDEYQSRFPDGLLELQMASVRRRAGESASDFIFP